MADRSLLLEDRVELPRLYLSWHSPAMFAPGDAELDLAADVLAHGKTSRLYRQLVYDQRVATDVSAYQHSRELSGLFQIACTAAAGVALPVLEQAMMEAVHTLAAHGPTAAELARAEAQTEAQFVYRLQTVGGFGGKSDQLNAYNVFNGNPGYFDADLARYQSVTGEGIATAVARWLVGQPRVALSVVPRGERALALTGRRRGPGLVSRVDRTALPVPGPPRPFAFPTIARTQLANGLHIRAVSHSRYPSRQPCSSSPAAPRQMPPSRPGWPRSPRICWTRAAAANRHSRSPTASPAWAATSISK